MIRIRILASLAAAPLLLLVLQALAAPFLLADMPAPPNDGHPALVLASSALMALTLAGVAAWLRPAGVRRVAVVFLLAGVIPANNLAEAAVFQLFIPRALLLRMLLHALALALLFALIVDRMLGRSTSSPAGLRTPVSAPLSLGRIAACDALFVGLYLVAGMGVLPFVQEFYGSRVPPLALVTATQLFRGLVFTGIVLALVRSLAMPRANAAVTTGLVLPLLAGVIPLLAPNPFMPSDVRWAHMVEVGISHSVFGAVAAWILGAPSSQSPEVAPASWSS